MPNKNQITTLIKNFWDVFQIIIAAITTLYTFRQLVVNNFDSIVQIVIISIISIWFTILLWIGFSKSNNGKFRYKIKHRYIASTFIIASAVIIAVYFVTLQNQIKQERAQRELKTVILIFKFDGPEEKYGIRNQIFEQLKQDFKNEAEFEIIPAKETIKPTDDDMLVKNIGSKYQADVAIWGWYQSITNPSITIHVENLNPTAIDELVESNAYVYRGTAKELDSFELQQKISTDVSDLISFLSGYIYYKGGNYNKALPYFEKSLQTSWVSNMVNQRDVFMNIAIEYTRLKQWDKAIESYNRAIEIDPKYELAYINRGLAHANMNQFDLAKADYDFAIGIDQENAEAYKDRGNVKMNQGQYTDAIKDYNQAIDLDNANLDAYANRGNAYASIEFYDLAVADYDRVIALDVNYVSAYYNRGLVYAHQKNYSIAILDFTKVIEFEPNNSKAYMQRGKSYQALGNYESTFSDFDRAAELDPLSIEVYNNRGYAYLKYGKYNDAITDFNKVIEINPSYALAYKRRAIAFEAIGKNNEAATDIETYRKLIGTP